MRLVDSLRFRLVAALRHERVMVGGNTVAGPRKAREGTARQAVWPFGPRLVPDLPFDSAQGKKVRPPKEQIAAQNMKLLPPERPGRKQPAGRRRYKGDDAAWVTAIYLLREVADIREPAAHSNLYGGLPACWIPARRAMRVDPMVALRHE